MIPQHPKDAKYFKDFPAPIMENLHSRHFININATLAYLGGPLLYFLVRALHCEKVLEIGTSLGYSSYYLASAVEDNRVRHSLKNAMFWGIDIMSTDFVKKNLDKKGLPNTILNMDTKGLTSETFKGVEFDLIFQDGCHQEEYVLHEMEVLYPQLKSNGYWLFHDAAGPSEKAWHKIIKNPKYKFDSVRLMDNIYGMGILHKIEGLDPEKMYWWEFNKEKK